VNTSGERNEEVEEMVVSKLAVLNAGRGGCRLIASPVPNVQKAKPASHPTEMDQYRQEESKIADSNQV
jgi:hypothetical protein